MTTRFGPGGMIRGSEPCWVFVAPGHQRSGCCDVMSDVNPWERLAAELRPDDDWLGRIKLTVALMRDSMPTKAERIAATRAPFGLNP
jgi:hypothetical protein